MSRTLSPALFSAGLVLALSLADAGPALAGPPWISVEYPANPHDRSTRGALMLVHTYHHGGAVPAVIRGTAEGLVSGRRKSLPLEVTPTARAGVYAVRGDIPGEGRWIVVLNMSDGQGGAGARASALVALGPQREAGAVKVPYDLVDGWMVPRAATAGEVEEMLRLAGALAQAYRDVAPLPVAGAALGALLLLPLARVRRVRRVRGTMPGAGR